MTITVTNTTRRGAIKAIPTRYHDVVTRSRLEARWMVVLDYLGISYYYEPQGYRFPDGTCYLCDFRIDPHPRWVGDGCWIEIKPTAPTVEEQRKAKLLARYLKKPVYILFGECCLPSELSKSSKEQDGGYVYYPDGQKDTFQWLYQCPRCKRNGIGLFGQSVESPCGCPIPSTRENDFNPTLLAAFHRAQGMRFDKK